jgi:hypothetical protein
MKGCDYKKRGDVVPEQWKAALLVWLAGEFKLNTLVETGTCIGGLCREIHRHFDKIYTVELSPEFYNKAKENFKENNITNVRQYFGSSRVMLRAMLDDVPPGPVLIYLDAHGSGNGTVDEGHPLYDGDPLIDELKIVMKFRPEALIVIDDCADCELEPAVNKGVDFTGWHKEYRTGEVIMYREGQYTVPPFEEV